MSCSWNAWLLSVQVEGMSGVGVVVRAGRPVNDFPNRIVIPDAEDRRVENGGPGVDGAFEDQLGR